MEREVERGARRRFLLGVLACALAWGGAASAQETPARELVHLVILHTNDIHGQVLPRPATWLSKEKPPQIGGLPRLAAKVAELRAAEPELLLVDAGDWYQGTPEGSLDRGLPFARALGKVGFDAVCVGNHEFDHGVANVERLVTEARLPAILANVRRAGARPAWAAPWIVVQRSGVRIAFVGLLTTSTPEITSAELRAFEFAEPAVELERALAEIGDRADLVVPVGHIAVEEARELARRVPKLALVVSGHSHTYLERGERAGDTLIVQTGSKASALGRVDLWLDPRTFAAVRSEAQLIDLLDEPRASEDPRAKDVAADCAQLAESASAALSVVVGELARPLSRAVERGCSAPGSWIADALRARMQADVGIHNRGGTRCDLPAGKVTRRQIFELLPFDNDVVAVDLNGEQLRALVRRAVEGTRHTGLDFSGLCIFVRRRADSSLALDRIEIAGRALDPAGSYRVATNSFLAGGGDGLAELPAGANRRSDPALLREVIEQVFARDKRVELPDDARARWVEVGP